MKKRQRSTCTLKEHNGVVVNQANIYFQLFQLQLWENFWKMDGTHALGIQIPSWTKRNDIGQWYQRTVCKEYFPWCGLAVGIDQQNMIQTHKMFKRMLIYYDMDTQSANSLCQATKLLKATVKWLKTMKNERETLWPFQQYIIMLSFCTYSYDSRVRWWCYYAHVCRL